MNENERESYVIELNYYTYQIIEIDEYELN